MRRTALILAAGTLSLLACGTHSDGSGNQTANSIEGAIPVHVIRRSEPTRAFRSDAELTAVVRSQLSLGGYREARIEELDNDGGSHLLVQLLLDGKHEMRLARIDLDDASNVQKVTLDHVRTPEDQVHGASPRSYVCPDPSVQFVSICPNDIEEEIGWANEAADAAEAAGLKTVRLNRDAATHDAWLNYMACPNLIGNFYDGDASPNEIVVRDGAITASEFTSSVNFRLRTTNIWLACQAYNDPMRHAVETDAKSQKYAAGINNLLVGPSDKAAVCAMKAAIGGKAITQALEDCRAQLNVASDHWGIGGAGSDYFGKPPSSTP
jgi:hypothetical protein